MTCKNLLAPENGDIEYILEENERDDVTILQVCVFVIHKRIKKEEEEHYDVEILHFELFNYFRLASS